VSLREQQRATTRDQIVEAVHHVLVEDHPASLSMPRIAERAGVSLRTVYRYFPTKEALVDAASETFRVPDVGEVVGLDGLPAYLTRAWIGFSEHLASVRSQHITPVGRAIRDRRIEPARRITDQSLRAAGVDLGDEQALLVDLVVAMTSSSTFLELCDRLDNTPEDAARVTAWAVQAVVDRAITEGAITP
jgi:AcrR family transcriptional regulator